MMSLSQKAMRGETGDCVQSEDFATAISKRSRSLVALQFRSVVNKDS